MDHVKIAQITKELKMEIKVVWQSHVNKIKFIKKMEPVKHA